MILAAILYRIDSRQLFGRLRLLSPAPLLWALVPLFFSVYIKGKRWNVLIRGYGVHEPLWHSVHTYAVAIAYGMITPGRVGEFWKAQSLTRNGVPLERALVAAVLDRLLDLVSLAALALGVLLPQSWFVIACLAALGGAFVIVFLRAWRSLGRRLAPLLLRRMGRTESDAGLPEEPWQYAPLALWTMLFWGLYFWQIGCLAAAAGLPLDATEWVVAVAASAIAAMLPISIMGLGTREAALLYFLADRAPAPTIVLFSLLYLYIYFSGALLGYLVSLTPRK